MATRGKRLSKEDVIKKQIADTDEKIFKKQSEINELKNKKAQLLKDLENLEMQSIQTLLEEKGMTVAELRAIVEASQETNTKIA